MYILGQCRQAPRKWDVGPSVSPAIGEYTMLKETTGGEFRVYWASDKASIRPIRYTDLV